MKIPKSFQVFASTINVTFDNERMANQSTFGECSLSDGKIILCDKYKGEKITKDCLVNTFYHEKVHIILDAMGEYHLSKNEKFVEIFSQLLRQTDETQKY